MPVGPGQVRICALGQSGFLLRFPSGRILVDGFFSPHPDRLVEAPIAPHELNDLELIAFTHEHGDHLDIDAVPDLAGASPKARLIAPRPCVAMLTAAGIPEGRIVGMQPHEHFELGGIVVHALPALHAVTAGDPYTFGEASGGAVRFLGYVFSAGGVSVFHAGDTLDYEGFARSIRALHVDVALLPINGRDPERESRGIAGNLDAEEAAGLAAESGVDVVIPMHYDMFAANPGFPEDVVRALRAKGAAVTVVVPAAGKNFIYTKPL